MTHANRPATPVPAVQVATPAPESKPPSGLNLSRRTQQTIGIVAMLLCLLVAGGIMYWFLVGSLSHARQVKVDPSLQTPGFGRPGGLPPGVRRALGVEKVDAKNWQVRGTAGAMRVARDDKGVYQFNFFYPNGAGISPQDNQLWVARGRALRDQAMAKEWELSADQLAKLKKVDAGNSRLNPTPEQRQAVATQWETYMKATDGVSRMDSERQLVATLDAVAKTSQPASKQAAQAAVDQIKQILTPQQIEKMSK